MSFALPLFPLQSVLFPDGTLDLRIFEVRYLDLIQRCQKESAPFGVVCLTQGQEVRRAPAGGVDPGPEAFHDIGTLAHIESFARPQPGLLLIRCRGGRRFRLSSRQPMKHGLWTGEADYLDDDALVPVPPDLDGARVALQRILEQLKARASGDELARIAGPWRWGDCGWIANRWCELLPLGLELRQRFLALDNPLIRLELVSDLLTRFQIGPSSSGDESPRSGTGQGGA